MLKPNKKIDLLREKEQSLELEKEEALALRTFDEINKSTEEYTQESFALACELSDNHIISDIINMTNRKYSYTIIYEIADVLRVSIDYLLGRTDNPYLNTHQDKEKCAATNDLLKTLTKLLTENIFTLENKNDRKVLKCSERSWVDFVISVKETLGDPIIVKQRYNDIIPYNKTFDNDFIMLFAQLLQISDFIIEREKDAQILLIRDIPLTRFANRIINILDIEKAVEAIIEKENLYILDNTFYDGKQSYTEAILNKYIEDIKNGHVIDECFDSGLFKALVEKHDMGMPILDYDETGEIADTRYFELDLKKIEENCQKEEKYRQFK